MAKRIFSVDYDNIPWKKSLSVALSVVIALSLGNLMAFAEAEPTQEAPPSAAVSETDESEAVDLMPSATVGADTDQPAGQNTPTAPGVPSASETVGAPDGKAEAREIPDEDIDFEADDLAVATNVQEVILYASQNVPTVTGTIDNGTVTNSYQEVDPGNASLAMVFTCAPGYRIEQAAITVGSTTTTDATMADRVTWTYPVQTAVTEDIVVAVTTYVVYPVTHSFASGTPGYSELPYGVMSMLPGEFMAPIGTVFPSPVSPALGTKYEDPDTGLVWKLMRWTPGSVDIDGITVTSAHFVGIWEVTSLIDYPVTYEFVSGTSQYPVLPGDIRNMLPAATTAHPETVSAPATPVLNLQFDDGLIGVWEFKGWVPGSVTIDGDTVNNAHFRGTWEVVYYKEYTVSHQFAPQKPGQALPSAVLNVCPGSYQKSYDVPVVPTNFSPRSVTVPEGTWNFVGWEPSSARSTTDVTFVGTWALDPKVFDIAYVLNGGTNNPGNPTAYTSESPDITLASATRDGYIFQGWFTDEDLQTPATIPTGSTGNRTFFAKWTANTDVGYTVRYYLDGTTTSVASDKAVGGQTFDSTVTEDAIAVPGYTALAPTTQTTVLNAYGKKVVFFYAANPYAVSYTFVSGTSGTVLPVEVQALTPASFTAKHGDTVRPVALAQTTYRTSGGIWIFSTWDAPEKLVDAADVTFTGTWTYVSDSIPPAPDPPIPGDNLTPAPLPTPSPKLEISDEASLVAVSDPDYGFLWFVNIGTIAAVAFGISVTALRRRFARVPDEGKPRVEIAREKLEKNRRNS